MKKLTHLVIAPALGVALLAGCSPNGSTAALVNDVQIPESRVTSYAEGCAAVLDNEGSIAENAAALRPQMLKWAVLGEMSRQQAAANGGPSDDEMRDYVAEAGLTQLLENDACGEATLGVARHDLIALGLGADMASYFGAFDVELNPRYGHWDPARLEAGGSGSLSDAAPN